MKNLLELKRERAELLTQERSLLDVIKDKKEVPADDTQKLDSLALNIRSLQLQINATQRQEEEDMAKADSEKKKEVQQRAATDEKGIEKMATKAFHGFLRGVALTDLDDHEAALYKEALKRGQVISTDSKGGFLTPDYFSNEVIKSMKFYGGMLESAKIYDTKDGNTINFPRRDSTAMTATLIAEVGTPANAEIAYGRMTLEAYKYSTGVFRISNELIQDSIVNAEAEIIEVSAESFSRAFNTVFTNGDGVNKPQGLFQYLAIPTNNGIGKTGAAGAVVSYNDLVDLKYSVDKAYRNGAQWMFNDLTEAAIRKLVDSDGRPLWTMGDIKNGSPDAILGDGYVINNDVSILATGQASIAYGNFEKAFAIRRVNGIGIRRLNEIYATSDEVGYVAFMRVDSDIRDTNAVKLFKNA